MSSVPASRRRRSDGMNYKFQRLREKIRQAVVSGELTGKLPGERELARRFHVNAKTLSKALTDLAAEGLLSRSVGRGTFVKGEELPEPSAEGAWLLIVDSDVDESLIQNLKLINPRAVTCNDISAIRPSFLNQFSAVVDLANETPEMFIRDLVIRGIPVVAVGAEPRTYSINAVLLDTTLGVMHLARNLALSGHRRFLAIEERNQVTISESIRRSVARYCSDFSVDACSPAEVVGAMEYGATACICDSVKSATATLRFLREAGVSVPERMSVAAVGWTGNEYPSTGYFIDPRQKASAVAEIFRHGQPNRPTTLWLTGTLVDMGTTSAGVEKFDDQPEKKRESATIVA